MKKTEKFDDLRIDKWLWVTRFYKTRSLAAQAINAGHVRLNTNRIKSSKIVVIEDIILVKKNNLEYKIIVKGILPTRVSATIACTLYEETEQSKLARENAIKDKRYFNAGYKSSDGRPSKQDRREIQKLTGRFK
ncbi:MAG: RNA-binding S4 domain-containing protein [Thiohalomonadales bacterium]